MKARNGLRLRDQRVRKLVQRMRAVMPWLEDSDIAACRGWSELEILSSTVFAELRRNGVMNKDGEGRRLLSDYRGLRSAQLAYERELGMTPASRMAIKANGTKAALDLVGAMASAEPAETTETAEGDGKEVDAGKED